MSFPEVSADQFWKMTSDIRKRVIWDYDKAEFIGPGENDGTIFYLEN